jgi:uncharacterized protein (TIGR03067 family)
MLVSGRALGDDNSKKELEKLQGTWEVTSSMYAGKETPKEKLKNRKWVFKGDELTEWLNEDENDAQKYALTLLPDKTPKSFNGKLLNTSYKGLVCPFIYELKDDTLKVSFNPRPANLEKDRPTDFSSKEGTRNVVVTLKKKK